MSGILRGNLAGPILQKVSLILGMRLFFCRLFRSCPSCYDLMLMARTFFFTEAHTACFTLRYYEKSGKVGTEFPNFNFNVSHHGDFVAIASEPFCLVGLDVVFHALPVEQIIPDYINSFSPYFSSMEWYSITNAGTCDDRLKVLHRYWTLKESFVKAIGTGMEYPLNVLEFHHINWTNIYMNIHKEEAKSWKFWHFELKEGLFVSIARGSPCMATDSYKQALGEIDLDEGAYDIWLNLPNPSFLWRTVEELIPN